MKVLVTGAESVLGKAIHRQIMGKDKSSYEFLGYPELDVSDRETVMQWAERKQFDVIVNCADYGDVERAEAHPKLAEAVNHRGAENLTLAALMWDAVLIQISTDQVFSGRNNRPYREDDETEPLNVYGRTKLAGEEAIRKCGCRYVIIRTPMLYSEDSPFFCDWKDTLSYMKLNRDVSATKRAFTPTYADDLAKAIYQIVDHRLVDSEDIHDTFHYTNEEFCTCYDFVVEYVRLLAEEIPVYQVMTEDERTKNLHPYYTELDSEKFRQRFDISIPHWKESLAKCIATIKQQSNNLNK